MIAAAHQPHFLPWPRYLNKLASAETFIWLDTVTYRKNYFQNRARVLSREGEERWLTLPVHAHLDTLLRDVTLADARAPEKVSRTIEQYYHRAPHFAAHWPALCEALRTTPPSLSEADLHTLKPILAMLGLSHVRIVRASELGVTTEEPTDRLVQLCQRVGADIYIAGKGGREYMRLDRFADAGIEVIWQDVDPAALMYQRSDGRDGSALSVIDPLFHIGASRTAELTKSAWTAHFR